MLQGSTSILVDRELPQVYRIAETYPHFATFYHTRETLFSNEREVTVRVGSSLLGIPIQWIGHGQKVPLRSIEYQQTEGLMKGLVVLWEFDAVGSATRVTLTWNLKSTSFSPLRLVQWLIGKAKVKATVQRILRALKSQAESAS